MEEEEREHRRSHDESRKDYPPTLYNWNWWKKKRESPREAMMNARRISPNFKLLKLMEEEEREPHASMNKI